MSKEGKVDFDAGGNPADERDNGFFTSSFDIRQS